MALFPAVWWGSIYQFSTALQRLTGGHGRTLRESFSFAGSIDHPAVTLAQWKRSMPSLFKFLVSVAVLTGLAYLLVFSLANFVDLKPREISVTVPPDKFLKR
jgi:hypothetical protein